MAASPHMANFYYTLLLSLCNIGLSVIFATG